MIEFQLLETPKKEQHDQAVQLFKQPTDFLKGVVAMSGLPADDRVEVCFAGRSNVGKSSLINAVTRRKALARTSNTPGRTQEINFFTLGDDYYLVDLPGYGFAKAPKDVVKKWQALLKQYLSGRATLRRVFLLVDARHGVKSVDNEIMDLLDQAAVPFQVVLTKCDKLKKNEMDALVSSVQKDLQKHPTAYPYLIPTSSTKTEGLDILRAEIASFSN